MNLKPIFPLLFFEHEYLARYYSHKNKIFNRGQKHAYAGNCVSESLFKS